MFAVKVLQLDEVRCWPDIPSRTFWLSIFEHERQRSEPLAAGIRAVKWGDGRAAAGGAGTPILSAGSTATHLTGNVLNLHVCISNETDSAVEGFVVIEKVSETQIRANSFISASSNRSSSSSSTTLYRSPKPVQFQAHEFFETVIQVPLLPPPSSPIHINPGESHHGGIDIDNQDPAGSGQSALRENWGVQFECRVESGEPSSIVFRRSFRVEPRDPFEVETFCRFFAPHSPLFLPRLTAAPSPTTRSSLDLLDDSEGVAPDPPTASIQGGGIDVGGGMQGAEPCVELRAILRVFVSRLWNDRAVAGSRHGDLRLTLQGLRLEETGADKLTGSVLDIMQISNPAKNICDPNINTLDLSGSEGKSGVESASAGAEGKAHTEEKVCEKVTVRIAGTEPMRPGDRKAFLFLCRLRLTVSSEAGSGCSAKGPLERRQIRLLASYRINDCDTLREYTAASFALDFASALATLPHPFLRPLTPSTPSTVSTVPTVSTVSTAARGRASCLYLWAVGRVPAEGCAAVDGGWSDEDAETNSGSVLLDEEVDQRAFHVIDAEVFVMVFCLKGATREDRQNMTTSLVIDPISNFAEEVLDARVSHIELLGFLPLQIPMPSDSEFGISPENGKRIGTNFTGANECSKSGGENSMRGVSLKVFRKEVKILCHNFSADDFLKPGNVRVLASFHGRGFCAEQKNGMGGIEKLGEFNLQVHFQNDEQNSPF